MIKFMGFLFFFILILSTIQVSLAQEIKIPAWVRNNAKWWSNGEIDDKTFASGIQFMVKEGIIKIPISGQDKATHDTKIPDWVRNNAKWWSNGEIDDKTFVSGLQYLIKIGIISLVSDQSSALQRTDSSKCDSLATPAKKRLCEKEIEQEKRIQSEKENSTSYQVGPVIFYYVDNKIEKTSTGTILTIHFVVENRGNSDVAMSCPVNSCNYFLDDGQNKIQYTTNTLVYGSLILNPNTPTELEWSFYKGLNYDSSKEYSFKIDEPWGNGVIPLLLS